MNDDIHLRQRLNDLVFRSAMLVDSDDLDGWLSCFDEESRYIVVPRENRERGLPGALMHCDNKARLRDRLNCLRNANKFNPHFDRHIIGGSYLQSFSRGIASLFSTFMVVQTTKTGFSKLFCAGCYEDQIKVANDDVKFVERLVILDTFSIPTMLATPI